MSLTRNTTTERRHHPWQQLLTVVAAVALFAIGGCAQMSHRSDSSSPTSNPYDDSAHPLSDDQAMAQVVEPAKEIVAAANLEGINGGFSFASCNDQGEPPYQGRISLTFLIHGDPDAYFEQIQNAMVSHGWKAGAPPGQVFHGATLNKDGVTATMSLLPSDHSYGEIFLYGQCRNTTNHRNDGKTNSTDITTQLQPH